MFRSYTDIERTAPTGAPQRSAVIYNCDYCSEGWESETDTYIHRNLHHSRKLRALLHDTSNYACSVCVIKHNSSEQLLKHIKTHHLLSSDAASRVEREIFACDSCHCIFFNKAMLAIHLTVNHRKLTQGQWKLKLQCPVCQHSKKYISKHLFWHGFSITSCPICYVKCISIANMLEHVRTHQKYLYCDTCSCKMNRKSHFDSHVERHHINEIRHEINETNGDSNPISRFFIPQTVDTVPVMILNKKSHSKGCQIPSPVKICILCREICTDRDAMWKHILNHSLRVETKTDVFRCECGEQFSSNILLKQHIFKLKGTHQRNIVKMESFDSDAVEKLIPHIGQ